MADAKLEEANDAESIDDPAFQQGVFRQAYEETSLRLSGADLPTLRAINTARNEAIDDLAQAFAEEQVADCRSGCSFCCHQMVVCTPFEIFDMARHILDEKAPDEITNIKARLAQRAPLRLDVQSRRGSDKPCALLEDHRCLVYAHRPANCRTMLSTSRIACETSLIAQEQTIPFIPEPGVIAFLVQLGIDYALIQRRHVSTEKVEMSRALAIALDDFDAAFAAWCEGKDVFHDCHVDTGGLSNQAMAARAAVDCGLA